MLTLINAPAVDAIDIICTWLQDQKDTLAPEAIISFARTHGARLPDVVDFALSFDLTGKHPVAVQQSSELPT